MFPESASDHRTLPFVPLVPFPRVYFLLSGHCFMNHRREVSSQKPWHLSNTMSRLRWQGQAPLQEPGRGGSDDFGSLGACADCLPHSYLGIKWEWLLEWKSTPGSQVTFSKVALASDQIFPSPDLQKGKWGRFFHHISLRGLWFWNRIESMSGLTYFVGRASSTHWQMAGTPVFLSLSSKVNHHFNLYRFLCQTLHLS